MSRAREWKRRKRILRMLGRVPDKTVAARCGLSYRAVQAKRKRLGLPPCREHRSYTAGEDELIGSSVGPSRVAELLGLRLDQVKGRRRRLRARRR
jgi:hypothetical protein